MNQKPSMDVMKGYAIFMLCLFIFTMWGINLFSISQVETESLQTDPKKTELVEVGAVRSYNFKPKPFLYYYFKEMRYHITTSSKVPKSTKKPIFLINPPAKIDVKILRAVFSWVRKGGNLIVLMPDSHSVDKFTGIERRSNEAEVPEYLSFHLPYLYGIEQISPVKSAISRVQSASLYSIFSERLGNTNVFMTFKGKGRLVIIAHPDMISGKGLKLADNVVLITRLAEFLAPDKSIFILDTEPNLRLKARGRRLVKKTGTSVVKKKIDHYSLWSLLKANPISWVLAQMAIALSVFFYSTSRRFGRARNLVNHDSAALSQIKNLGLLLEEKGDTAFALSGMMKDFSASAIKRFGLDSDASFNMIIDEIRLSDPKVAQGLSNIEKEAFVILSGRNNSSNSLLRVVRALESARKELKLYD